jgi:hypothetical protein
MRMLFTYSVIALLKNVVKILLYLIVQVTNKLRSVSFRHQTLNDVKFDHNIHWSSESHLLLEN